MQDETITEVRETGSSTHYLVNGTMTVPKDPANRHYQAVLKWVAAGNTPSPHTPLPPRFNPDTAIAREAQVFATDRIIALAPFTYTINEMIRYENWEQLKQVIQGLIASGLALESDYQTFNSILKEQGVDLDTQGVNS